MKIFVDFDNTIFDTHNSFAEKVFDIFDNYGISRDVLKKVISGFSSTTYEGGQCHSLLGFMQVAIKSTGKQINQIAFENEVKYFLEDLEYCVYEDFYKFANDFYKKDLIILSYGDHDFQRQKIDGSGVSQFFVDTIITQGDKAVEIKKYMQNFPGESAVLVDDKSEYFKSVKKLPLNTKTVHIVRDDNKCESDAFCDYHVKELHSIDTLCQ